MCKWLEFPKNWFKKRKPLSFAINMGGTSVILIVSKGIESGWFLM
jgi:hypothetical protein